MSPARHFISMAAWRWSNTHGKRRFIHPLACIGPGFQGLHMGGESRPGVLAKPNELC
jgi:hypothetical protein